MNNKNKHEQSTFREFTDYSIEQSYSASGDEMRPDLNDFGPSYEAVDLDTKYRSMQAIDSASLSSFGSPAFTPYEPTLLPPQLRKDSAIYEVQTAKPSIGSISVPEKPFHLGSCHFLYSLSLNSLINSMERKLDHLFEVSYQFFEDQCRVCVPSLNLPRLII
jgi:hypothetical protein